MSNRSRRRFLRNARMRAIVQYGAGHISETSAFSIAQDRNELIKSNFKMIRRNPLKVKGGTSCDNGFSVMQSKSRPHIFVEFLYENEKHAPKILSECANLKDIYNIYQDANRIIKNSKYLIRDFRRLQSGGRLKYSVKFIDSYKKASTSSTSSAWMNRLPTHDPECKHEDSMRSLFYANDDFPVFAAYVAMAITNAYYAIKSVEDFLFEMDGDISAHDIKDTAISAYSIWLGDASYFYANALRLKQIYFTEQSAKANAELARTEIPRKGGKTLTGSVGIRMYREQLDKEYGTQSKSATELFRIAVGRIKQQGVVRVGEYTLFTYCDGGKDFILSRKGHDCQEIDDGEKDGRPVKDWNHFRSRDQKKPLT